MRTFRVMSPIFTAVIPDVQYGRSIKDFLEGPMIPGSYPAIVEGYFVMLKFTEGRLLGAFMGKRTPRGERTVFFGITIPNRGKASGTKTSRENNSVASLA